MTIADQLRQFNEERQRQFGRAPLPDSRLDIPYTGVGGDVNPDPHETDYDPNTD